MELAPNFLNFVQGAKLGESWSKTLNSLPKEKLEKLKISNIGVVSFAAIL